MRETKESTIKSRKIKSALRKQGVVLAYLFGSQVHGMTHRESDVDIAVLLDKKISAKKYFGKSLKLPGIFQGLYPGKERVVTILNEAPPLLKHEVIAGGCLLYARRENDWVRFHLDTVRAYEDTKYLRQSKWQDLQARINTGDY